MKSKKPNAAEVWKQVEDQLVPRLRLSLTERAVYYHLVRHSRLEGHVCLRFSIASLARGTGLSCRPVRLAVRRLAASGALRLRDRSMAGHVAEVRLPEEIPGVGRADGEPRNGARLAGSASLEEKDVVKSKALRQAIYAREGGLCFYCLRRVTAHIRVLDHVVPLVHSGSGSYRNVVLCCLECNTQKGKRPAGDFLRGLYRDGRLTAAELTGRLRALEDLASGKLSPALAGAANPLILVQRKTGTE